MEDLRTLAPPAKLPSDYDGNITYEFHYEAPSHNFENCKALKHEFQELIDSKEILLTPGELSMLKKDTQTSTG